MALLMFASSAIDHESVCAGEGERERARAREREDEEGEDAPHGLADVHILLSRGLDPANIPLLIAQCLDLFLRDRSLGQVTLVGYEQARDRVACASVRRGTREKYVCKGGERGKSTSVREELKDKREDA
jgi:hypothetical protein